MSRFSKHIAFALAFALSSGAAFAFTGPGSQSAGSGGGLFYVDANRNIGFGLTTPSPAGTFDDNSTGFGYTFTVASTTNPGLSIRNLSANGKTYIWSSRNSGNLNLYRESFGDLVNFPGKVIMDITPIGNVGISVFNPTQRLEVGGNVSSTAYYGSAVNLTSIDPKDFIAGSAFAAGNYAVDGSLIVGATSTSFIPAGTGFTTTGTSTLATAAGRVGIGTASPNALLQVGSVYTSLASITPIAIVGGNSNSIQSLHLENSNTGASAEMRFVAKANDGAYLAFTQPGTGNTGTFFGITKGTGSFILNAGVSRTLAIGTNLSGNLVLGTNNLERMRILGSNGSVGIGTPSPSSTLHVVGTSTVSSGDVRVATNGFGFVFPDGTRQTTAAAGGNLWSASSTDIYNSNAGNVGIGTSVPAKKLTVQLSDSAGADEFLVKDSTGAQVFSLDSDGNVLFAAYPATINFNNAQTINFNAIAISDPGPGEGLSWNGTSAGWTLDVAPLDRVTNGDGNFNIYGSANNVAVWRPLLLAMNSSTYTTATPLATGLNFTTTGGSGHINFNPTGNVGIGTTAPSSTLQVIPESAVSIDVANGRIQSLGSPVNATDAATRSYVDSLVSGGASGVWILSGSSLYASSTSWSVGIGTTSPSANEKLTVSGRIRSTDYIESNSSYNINAYWSNTNSRWERRSDGSAFQFVSSPGDFPLLIQRTASSTAGTAITWSSALTIAQDTGYVGIGTTTPAFPLEVEPSGAISADMSTGRIQNLGSPVNATDAATRGYVDSTISGGSGSTVGYWTASSTDIYNSNSGNVGIGAASSPSYKLKVFGTFAADSGLLYTDNAGTLTGTAFYDRNNAAYFVDPSAATSMKTAGSVMIGGSGAPATTLHVAGTIRADNTLLLSAGDADTGQWTQVWDGANDRTYIGFSGAQGGQLQLYANGTSNGSTAIFYPTGQAYFTGGVSIATSTLGTSKLYVNGSATFEGSIDLKTNSIAMNGGNIGNVGKLTVTAIDPLYEIDGKKYATYAPSIAGGVKEEYVGRGSFGEGETEYAVDFEGVKAGSDLWVWYNAVDFSADGIEVLATAYETPVPIAYEVKGKSIIFRTAKEGPLSFSYRLIGRRHDWASWPTYAKDQRETPSFTIQSK